MSLYYRSTFETSSNQPRRPWMYIYTMLLIAEVLSLSLSKVSWFLTPNINKQLQAKAQVGLQKQIADLCSSDHDERRENGSQCFWDQSRSEQQDVRARVVGLREITAQHSSRKTSRAALQPLLYDCQQRILQGRKNTVFCCSVNRCQC